MSKEYVFQHYVPRTYIEAWENNDGKLKIHKKESGEYFYRSSNSIMGENDYYTLNADTLLALSNQEKIEIFGDLNTYIIEFEGRQLTTIDDFVKKYYSFDKWHIRNKDGSDIDVKGIKENIEKKRILGIEKAWHKIESEWKQVRNEIIKAMEDTSNYLSYDVLVKLVSFITAQKSRNDSKKGEYRVIIDSFISSIKDAIDDKEYKQIINEFTDAYFLKSIKQFQVEAKDSLLLKEQKMIESLHTVFYKAVPNKKFYTSDNPVFAIVDKKFYKGKYAGLYFPISPDILVGFYNGEAHSYTKHVMPVNMMRRINKKIIENSNRFYVVPENRQC